MNKTIKRILFIILIVAIIVAGVISVSKIMSSQSESTYVTNGTLSYEESAEGYVIRSETVLQGSNTDDGIVQIVLDGEKVAKGESFFRYYSSNEDDILTQISTIDEQINDILENSNINIVTSDISSLEQQIESTIDGMYKLNSIQSIQEAKNKLDTYVSKKTELTAESATNNSEIKALTDQRNTLKKQIEDNSEVIYAPVSGIATYKVDGLEETLTADNFDYLSLELLNSFDLKIGATIPLSNEKGKIVDNFSCYIAVPISTEKASSAKVGDTCKLRLSNTDEIDAEIVYIKDEGNTRILVFQISDDVAELIDYRKISLDIIWWEYSGLKISNTALIDENGLEYVEKSVLGNKSKILVKVLRQNDTYSIIENYDDDELRNLGYSEEEIDDMEKIQLYDILLLH